MLTEKDSHRISFYDTTSGEQLASVALPDFPHEFVVDAGRRYAYAGHYGVLSGSLNLTGSGVHRNAELYDYAHDARSIAELRTLAAELFAKGRPL